VVVLDDLGRVQLSARPYDNRVARVISGAGDYRPGLVLDRRQSAGPRRPVALMGKVNCLGGEWAARLRRQRLTELSGPPEGAALA
jgi:hypothetical protein